MAGSETRKDVMKRNEEMATILWRLKETNQALRKLNEGNSTSNPSHESAHQKLVQVPNVDTLGFPENLKDQEGPDAGVRSSQSSRSNSGSNASFHSVSSSSVDELSTSSAELSRGGASSELDSSEGRLLSDWKNDTANILGSGGTSQPSQGPKQDDKHFGSIRNFFSVVSNLSSLFVLATSLPQIVATYDGALQLDNAEELDKLVKVSLQGELSSEVSPAQEAVAPREGSQELDDCSKILMMVLLAKYLMQSVPGNMTEIAGDSRPLLLNGRNELPEMMPVTLPSGATHSVASRTLLPVARMTYVQTVNEIKQYSESLPQTLDEGPRKLLRAYWAVLLMTASGKQNPLNQLRITHTEQEAQELMRAVGDTSQALRTFAQSNNKDLDTQLNSSLMAVAATPVVKNLLESLRTLEDAADANMLSRLKELETLQTIEQVQNVIASHSSSISSTIPSGSSSQLSSAISSHTSSSNASLLGLSVSSSDDVSENVGPNVLPYQHSKAASVNSGSIGEQNTAPEVRPSEKPIGEKEIRVIYHFTGADGTTQSHEKKDESYCHNFSADAFTANTTQDSGLSSSSGDATPPKYHTVSVAWGNQVTVQEAGAKCMKEYLGVMGLQEPSNSDNAKKVIALLEKEWMPEGSKFASSDHDIVARLEALFEQIPINAHEGQRAEFSAGAKKAFMDSLKPAFGVNYTREQGHGIGFVGGRPIKNSRLKSISSQMNEITSTSQSTKRRNSAPPSIPSPSFPNKTPRL